MGRARVVLLLLAAGVFATGVPGRAEDRETVPPLLTWDMLRLTHYDPRREITWPQEVLALQGKVVRMEGYLLPNYGAQDPGDLLLSRSHPRSLFCGPTDMTALVEMYYPGFKVNDWPWLPVEVTGEFSLSRNPRNMFSIYRLRVSSWRELRRWEQEFPGVVEEDEFERPGDRG
jgi:hypothetical protein